LSDITYGKGFTKKEKERIFLPHLGSIFDFNEMKELVSFLEKVKRVENAQQEGKIEEVGEEIKELERYYNIHSREHGEEGKERPNEFYHYG